MAFKQEKTWLIFKVLDLGGIYSDMSFNIDKYSEFNKLINTSKPYIHEFLSLKMQTEHLIQTIHDKFQQLIPSQRSKRGILNPLGSVIKVITGNLDHDDAIRYDSQISELKANHRHVEKKLTLISEMLDSFINNTETLHNDTLVLDERLKRIENSKTYPY